MDYTIYACEPGNEITFTDVDIKKIADTCDPEDRYAVERIIEDKVNKLRPGSQFHFHIYSLKPFLVNGVFGNVDPDWWKVGPWHS